MTLLFVYIVSAVAIFIDLEYVRLAGCFLSICLIPGLSIFAILKKELNFSDIILAILTSLGVSIFLTILMLFIGIKNSSISTIIIILTGIPVLYSFFIDRKAGSYVATRISQKEKIFSVCAVLITVLLALPVLTGPDSMDISSHSYFHTALSGNVMDGIFPPENPGLGGTETAYPWGGNAFTAMFASVSGTHPLEVNAMLNVLSLFLLISIVYMVGSALGFSEGMKYLTVLAVFGLMRSDAGAVFAAKIMSGNFMSFQDIRELSCPPGQVMSEWAWSEKLPLYDVRLRFLDKFYNAGFMALSLCFIFAYFYILIRSSNDDMSKQEKIVCRLSLFFCIGGNTLFYLALAIIPLLHLPFWMFYLFITAKGGFQKRYHKISYVFWPFFWASIATAPYILKIKAVTSTAIKTSGASGQLLGFLPSWTNIVVYWLPFPLIVLGLWYLVRKTPPSGSRSFLLTGTGLFFFMAAFVEWGVGNEYKFSYIVLFFFAILFVMAIEEITSRIHRPVVKKLAFAVLILFLSGTPFLVEASYFLSSRYLDNAQKFSGRHILFADDIARNEAYEWIRNNTPPDSLVMLTYNKTKTWDCPASNITYKPAAFLERSMFVMRDIDYVMRNIEFAKREDIWVKLFENPDDPAVLKYLASLNRPVYLLVESDSDELPESTENRFSLKFQSDHQRVYFINNSRQ
ncbi:MAG: hypothetical protein ISR96_12235 [Nitrospira sp.]|nr:hypothetical protein [Candidatus Brocadiales bacterium]MBL7050273.1 hypothetical protein [Nitrospira sp.]